MKERVVELFRSGEEHRQALPLLEEAERPERFLVQVQVVGLRDREKPVVDRHPFSFQLAAFIGLSFLQVGERLVPMPRRGFEVQFTSSPRFFPVSKYYSITGSKSRILADFVRIVLGVRIGDTSVLARFTMDGFKIRKVENF